MSKKEKQYETSCELWQILEQRDVGNVVVDTVDPKSFNFPKKKIQEN